MPFGLLDRKMKTLVTPLRMTTGRCFLMPFGLLDRKWENCICYDDDSALFLYALSHAGLETQTLVMHTRTIIRRRSLCAFSPAELELETLIMHVRTTTGRFRTPFRSLDKKQQPETLVTPYM